MVDKLCAITSYFNPVGYERKLRNYRAFRDHLDVPLVTVELSHQGAFELAPGDAERLIQIRGGDVMWQKERLLNLAMEHLPEECEYVAWLDCDIVFGRPDWPSAAIEQLRRDEICQLYRTVYHLGPAADGAAIGRAAAIQSHDSFGYAHSAGIVTKVNSVTSGVPNTFKRGHAWCGKRDLLDRFGIYDRNVIGGGDTTLAFAASAQWEEVIVFQCMGPGHAADYRQWSIGFHDATQGRVGYVDGDVFHLWHGDLMQRRYEQRYKILSAFGYDPATDIAFDTQGCWRWNSPKYAMHEKVSEYFEVRNEDGSSQPSRPRGRGAAALRTSVTPRP